MYNFLKFKYAFIIYVCFKCKLLQLLSHWILLVYVRVLVISYVV